jgi:tetratricopeptide (TPR) repeat protein
MKRSLGLLTLLVLVAGSAAPADDPDALVRAGYDAYAHGDFAKAVECFQKASERTTDPPLVAFNLASARYRLALKSAEGRAANLREAEQLFLCCLDKSDPRRLTALNGLGACLLRQALDGDDSRAQRAVECLSDCLEQAEDAELIADARHNLALARLIVAQTTRQQDAASRDNPPNPDEDKTHPTRPKDRTRPSDGGRGLKGEKVPVKGEAGTKTVEGQVDTAHSGTEKTEGKDSGSRPRTGPDGQSPYIADAQHLDEALERIREQQRKAKTASAGTPAAGVKDW